MQRFRFARVALLLVLASSSARGGEGAGGALRMTPAVACRSIHGYEDYEPLPDAALTSDEKLLVYYRPLGYQTGRVGPLYHIHLTQDGRIRRSGEQAVLLSKQKLLDYEYKNESIPFPIYLRNTISLRTGAVS